jgi:serine/threonine protein kinase
MGDVWQATDQLLARTVAAKVLVPALLGDPTFEVRFQVEARMLATVEHPGIVSVYDFGKCQLSTGVTVAYLVMPYVDGVPLSRWITALGRLSVGHTTSVVAQAADALHAAHRRGIVHRDVTPANLLIDRHGTVVLVDFGVAHAAAESTHGRHGVLATPLYMAPERVTGGPVSPATDVYALGAVMYHCLAGRPPFTGDSALAVASQHVHASPPPLPPDVPKPVQALVFQALAKEPAARPPSGALATAVRAAGHAEDQSQTATTVMLTGPNAATVPLPAPIPPRRRRRPGRAPVGAGIVVGVALAAATAIGLRDPTDAPATVPPAPARTSEPAPAVTTTKPPQGGAGQAPSVKRVDKSPAGRSSDSAPRRSPSTTPGSAPSSVSPSGAAPGSGSPTQPTQPSSPASTPPSSTGTPSPTPSRVTDSPTASTTAPRPTGATAPSPGGE